VIVSTQSPECNLLFEHFVSSSRTSHAPLPNFVFCFVVNGSASPRATAGGFAPIRGFARPAFRG
jgi:hypothetical protein